MNTAYIAVDLQNDFLPGGSLAIKGGDTILPEAIRFMEQTRGRTDRLVILTADAHPADHASFASTHNRNVLDTIALPYGEQTLWPDHCVEGTFGAEIATPVWNAFQILDGENNRVFKKGQKKFVDSYSAFIDAAGVETGLADYLRSKGVSELVVFGLAYDYCVKATAIDGVKLGFKVKVMTRACAAVAAPPIDAARQMTAAGVVII